MLAKCLPTPSTPELLPPKVRASGIQIRWKQPLGIPTKRWGVSWKADSWWSSVTDYVTNTKEGEQSLLLPDIKAGDKVTVWIWSIGEYSSSAYTEPLVVELPDNIFTAVFEKNLKRCKEIFDANGKSEDFLSAGDEDGVTCTHWAAWRGATDILAWLLENGARADIYAEGMLPIHWACCHTVNANADEESLFQCVLLLKKHTGCLTDILTEKGRSILSLAIHSNLVTLTTKIIQLGASFTIPDRNGDLPIHWASYGGNVFLIDSLWNAGASLHVFDHESQSPLHLASLGGHADAVKFIAERSTKELLHAKDKHGQTALDIAVSKKFIDVVNAIREAMMLEVQRRLILFYLIHNVGAIQRLDEIGSYYFDKEHDLNIDLQATYGANLTSPHVYDPTYWQQLKNKLTLYEALFVSVNPAQSEFVQTVLQAAGNDPIAADTYLQSHHDQPLAQVDTWLTSHFKKEMEDYLLKSTNKDNNKEEEEENKKEKKEEENEKEKEKEKGKDEEEEKKNTKKKVKKS